MSINISKTQVLKKAIHVIGHLNAHSSLFKKLKDFSDTIVKKKINRLIDLRSYTFCNI